MQLCFCLLLLFPVTEGCILKNNGQTKYITAYAGDSVQLPCSCTDQLTKPEDFTWKKLHAYSDTVVSNNSDQYRNRVQLFTAHSPGNLSLLISHLTEEDKGTYRCELKRSTYKDIVLTIKGCILKNNGQTKYITAYAGDSVQLPCSCTNQLTKPEDFTWKKLHAYSDTVVSNNSDQYRNRVQLFTAHSPGNLSLLISHLTEEDKGTYRCELKRSTYKDIVLTIKGCILENNGQTKHITAYAGDSVLLPCSCTDQLAKPEDFTWRKFQRKINKWDVISSESDQYRNRVQLSPAHSPGNLSLLISNLRKDDGGDYECYVNTYEHLYISLSLKGIPPTTFTPSFDSKISTAFLAAPSTTASSNSTGILAEGYMLYYIAVGAVLLLLLLVGLLGVVCWRYKVQSRRQSGLGEQQTLQEREQETQEDLNELYETVNAKTECKTAQAQDEVTYSAVVYSQKTKPSSTPVNNTDTEYASIKFNSN